MRTRMALVAVAAMLTVGGCTTDGPGGRSSGTVDPNKQDPSCHRAALAAASSNPGFEWNKSGMGAYHSNYDTCISAGEIYGR